MQSWKPHEITWKFHLYCVHLVVVTCGVPKPCVDIPQQDPHWNQVFFPEAGLKLSANDVKALSPKVDLPAKSSATHTEPCKQQFIENIIYIFWWGLILFWTSVLPDIQKVRESLDSAAKLLSEKNAEGARVYPQKTTCFFWTFCPSCFSWVPFQVPYSCSSATLGSPHHLAQLGPSSHSTSLHSCNMRDLRDRIHPNYQETTPEVTLQNIVLILVSYAVAFAHLKHERVTSLVIRTWVRCSHHSQFVNGFHTNWVRDTNVASFMRFSASVYHLGWKYIIWSARKTRNHKTKYGLDFALHWCIILIIPGTLQYQNPQPPLWPTIHCRDRSACPPHRYASPSFSGTWEKQESYMGH